MNIFAYIVEGQEVDLSKLISQGVSKIICIDRHLSSTSYCERLIEKGFDVYIHYNEDNLESPDYKKLTKAKYISKGQIALGNDVTHAEVRGFETVLKYSDFAKEQGIEWICPISPRQLMRDMTSKSQPLRKLLEDRQIPCLSTSFYVIFGYLYHDQRIPHQLETILALRNLHDEYNITEDAFKNYFKNIRLISGAGGQVGIEAGSLIYAERLGINDMIISPPFDINIESSPNNLQEYYPKKAGNFCTYAGGIETKARALLVLRTHAQIWRYGVFVVAAAQKFGIDVDAVSWQGSKRRMSSLILDYQNVILDEDTEGRMNMLEKNILFLKGFELRMVSAIASGINYGVQQLNDDVKFQEWTYNCLTFGNK